LKGGETQMSKTKKNPKKFVREYNNKGIKIRLYPTEDQALLIDKTISYNTELWNRLVEMTESRRKAIHKTYAHNYKDKDYEGVPNIELSAFSLGYIVSSFKKTDRPQWKEIDSQTLINTADKVSKAYKAWHNPKQEVVKKPKKHDTFLGLSGAYYSKFAPDKKLQVSKAFINIPKLGNIKFKGGQSFYNCKTKGITVSKDSLGNYYGSVLIAFRKKQPKPVKTKVGLDVGQKTLVSTSDAVKYATKYFNLDISLNKHHWEILQARRGLASKKRVANLEHNGKDAKDWRDVAGYQNARHQVAKYNKQSANRRTDYLQKITTILVNQYDMIVMEDIKVSNLNTKKGHNGRKLANQSWRALRSMLEYKCKQSGKTFKVVNPYKTSQICPNCGYDDGWHGVSSKAEYLNVREWTCPKCNKHHDRDIGAAQVILSKAF